jgi:hypothetical protein
MLAVGVAVEPDQPAVPMGAAVDGAPETNGGNRQSRWRARRKFQRALEASGPQMVCLMVCADGVPRVPARELRPGAPGSTGSDTEWSEGFSSDDDVARRRFAPASHRTARSHGAKGYS